MLRPRENFDIRLERFSLKISPAYRLRWIRDLYENNVGLVDLAAPAKELLIEMECQLDISEENPFNFRIAPDAAEYPFSYEHELLPQLQGLIDPLYPRDLPMIDKWLKPLWHPGMRLPTLDLLLELNKTIYRDIRYQRRERKGVQSPAETLELKSGSCRDFAALLMETCRSLGLAARFVSGYMYAAQIAGRMSMHGWAEIYLPGAGWIGFDPSWGILAASQYIPVAVTRNPRHVPPISGTFFGFQKDHLGTAIDLYVERLDNAVNPQQGEINVEALTAP
jgi:transglutaminase-like putative cysteine protease